MNDDTDHMRDRLAEVCLHYRHSTICDDCGTVLEESDGEQPWPL